MSDAFPRPLTLADLTTALCQSPGCTTPAHHLKAACHPSKGLRVSFSSDASALILACDFCRKLVVRVAVAP